MLVVLKSLLWSCEAPAGCINGNIKVALMVVWLPWAALARVLVAQACCRDIEGAGQEYSCI